MGQIKLDVIFGTKENYRREPIWFEVVDHQSAYHAILGRPALAKFMAIPHYAYLKMKMPGEKGIITVVGDYRLSLSCASAGAKMADAILLAEELKEIKRKVVGDPTPAPGDKKPANESAFKAAKDTRKVLLNPTDPTKFVLAGLSLDGK